MSRLAWTDPAPLKVERPRLPWWTLLPRKLVLAASPVIVVVVMVLVFVARRVWRYPQFLIGATILTGLGMGYSWWAVAWLLTAVALRCWLWAWGHLDSFDRLAARQVRSEWRRALVYAWPWKRVMLFSELTKHTGYRQRSTHYPRLCRVRSDGWRDRVLVTLLHGQYAHSYAVHAAELANSFGVQACRVRVDKPRRVWLDFLHSDPLAQAITVPALVEPGTGGQFARRESPEIARTLLAWAHTLTEVTPEAWRVPSGDCVHLSVIGQLPGGVSIRVHGGVPFTEHGIGGDLVPDASTSVPLAVPREQATVGQVTL